MAEDFKIVYCFNGWKWIWRQLVLSLTTLRRFVDDNIVVFYGPPRFQEHIEWLTPLCDLRLVETPLHESDFLRKRVYFRKKFYGSTMKLHAYNLDTPNLIWIDSDTVITGDVREILKGDFDVSVARWQNERSDTYMDELCEVTELPHINTMMAGFVVFKNHAHNKMKKHWLKYITKLFMGELKPPHSERFDLPAFNLALTRFMKEGGKMVEMPKGWHSYDKAKYVQHLAHREFAIRQEKEFFTPELYKLVEIGEDNGGW